MKPSLNSNNITNWIMTIWEASILKNKWLDYWVNPGNRQFSHLLIKGWRVFNSQQARMQNCLRKRMFDREWGGVFNGKWRRVLHNWRERMFNSSGKELGQKMEYGQMKWNRSETKRTKQRIHRYYSFWAIRNRIIDIVLTRVCPLVFFK